MPQEPGKIRNVAVVGHRGTGKTSLVEAMLFQAGAINRLGTVEAGTTVSDWDEDEQRRQMSLAASLCHLEWQGRKINLIDTPGDSGFQADTIASLQRRRGRARRRLRRDGRRGEHRRASGRRAEALELSRVVFVNMLDRERADFYRTLAALQEQLSDRCVAIQLPIGDRARADGDRRPAAQLRLPGSGAARAKAIRSPIPDEMAGVGGRVPREAPRRGRRDRRGADGALPRRRGARPGRRRGGAEDARSRTTSSTRSPAASRRRTSARTRCSTCSSRACRRRRASRRRSRRAAATAAFVFKTVADPFAGRINVFRVFGGTVAADSTLVNLRDQAKERLGGLMMLQGKEHEKADGVRRRRHRRGREAEGRPDRRRARRRRARARAAAARVPRAGDELRGHAEDEGRRGQGRPGAPPAARGGSDAAAAPRPADRASSCSRA